MHENYSDALIKAFDWHVYHRKEDAFLR